MNGSGKAGNGRGNNRRRSFRRHNSEVSKQENESPGKNGVFQKAGGSEARQLGNGNQNNLNQRPSSQNEGKWHENSSAKFNTGRQKPRGPDAGENRHAPFVERPKWIPPKLNTDPLPNHDCPWCGKPIRDISQAIADKNSGLPVHFDCVAAKIAEGEILEKGDTITYIGGGRFGVVNFRNDDETPNHRPDSQRNSPASPPPKPYGCEFKIKKIIEWENKERKAEWRFEICDHYSVT